MFPAPVNIALVEATCTAPDSTDSRGNRITFNPFLTVDGVPDTAWRCPGASIHQALAVHAWPDPRDVTALAAIPGYAGADPFNGMDRFDQNRRVTGRDGPASTARAPRSPAPSSSSTASVGCRASR